MWRDQVQTGAAGIGIPKAHDSGLRRKVQLQPDCGSSASSLPSREYRGLGDAEDESVGPFTATSGSQPVTATMQFLNSDVSTREPCWPATRCLPLDRPNFRQKMAEINRQIISRDDPANAGRIATKYRRQSDQQSVALEVQAVRQQPTSSPGSVQVVFQSTRGSNEMQESFAVNNNRGNESLLWRNSTNFQYTGEVAPARVARDYRLEKRKERQDAYQKRQQEKKDKQEALMRLYLANRKAACVCATA
jgi:hypothetical protein